MGSENDDFWEERREFVTGEARFLGRFVVQALHLHGAKDVFVPRLEDYDLTQPEAIQRLLDDTRPDLIIHLAALAGCIGANRACPAEFFYKNLMMGVPVKGPILVPVESGKIKAVWGRIGRAARSQEQHAAERRCIPRANLL
jgi:hypothetical protein